MRTMLKLFLIATVIANLAVPEKVVRYGDCCYDDNGNLNASHFNKSRNSGERIHGRSCCDPTEYQLRAGAPSAAQLELQINPDSGKAAVLVADLNLNSRYAPTYRTTNWS